MESNRPLRIAIIGCGAVAQQQHLPVLAGHEDVEMVALVDRDTKRAADLARGYGVPHVFAECSELNSGLIDAAILATPPSHHAPGTIDLLRRGIHVLVEKPMAISAADAEEMVRVADAAGLVLSVGFFRRLYPSLRLLKSLLDSGWLGRPRSFLVQGGGMYNWAAATLANMKKESAGGGALIDYGSHLVDMLFALFDDPAEILEYRDNALGGVEADCVARLRMQYAGQPVEGILEVARSRELPNCIRIECERGALEFHLSERFRIRVEPHGPELTDPVSGEVRNFRLEAGWIDSPVDESWLETARSLIDDWIGAIRNGRSPVVSGRSSLPTPRLIESCYRRKTGLDEPWVTGGINRAVPSTRESGLKRVLVTGASGFIGSRVAEVLRLREGLEVRALVHNPGSAARLARLDVELVQADLESADFAQLVTGCDAVVHCAVGTAWDDRRKNFAVTVDGTRRLAEAALPAGVQRFVHLSTISVYGDDAIVTGMLDESAPLRPAAGSEYGETKAQAERAVTQLAQRGLIAAILRPARVFGPFSRIFINRPLQAMAKRQFRWLGNPDVPADMVYVDNVVAAILAAFTAPADQIRGQAFNVGDGDTMTWRAFYQVFATALGLDLDAAPIHQSLAVAKKSALRRVLGWPVDVAGGVGAALTSPEFKAFGRRVLETDSIGSIPRWAFQRAPIVERGVRRLVGADDSPLIYRRNSAPSAEWTEMGSGGALVSIEKAQRLMGYRPMVSRAEAMGLTLDWVKYARLV